MSKLVQRLEQGLEGGTRPLGFAARAAVKSLPLALVARFPKGSLKALANINQGMVDALLFPPPSEEEMPKLKEALSHIPWGLALDASQKGEEWQEKGCDFILFPLADTPAKVLLEEEGLGKILEVDFSLPDAMVAALDALPIETLYISLEGRLPLSLVTLLSCQRLLDLSGKPLLAGVPTSLSQKDIETLWELGVAGLILPMEKWEEKALARLRQAIEALPTRRKKEKGRLSPVLPYARPSPTSPQKEEEEEEEEE